MNLSQMEVISRNWMLLRKNSILDFTDKYTHWLIPRFTPINKELKLIFELIYKLIIRNDMRKQEKKVYTEMLYNREVVIA